MDTTIISFCSTKTSDWDIECYTFNGTIHRAIDIPMINTMSDIWMIGYATPIPELNMFIDVYIDIIWHRKVCILKQSGIIRSWCQNDFYPSPRNAFVLTKSISIESDLMDGSLRHVEPRFPFIVTGDVSLVRCWKIRNYSANVYPISF